MGKFVKTAALCLPACAMLALAQPVQAGEAANAAAVKAADAVGQNAPKKAGREKKYCMRMTPDTGSRITTQACKTKAEWTTLDVEVPAEK